MRKHLQQYIRMAKRFSHSKYDSRDIHEIDGEKVAGERKTTLLKGLASLTPTSPS